MKKRLFLFAGYSKTNQISPAVVFYVSQLAALGDVILCFDSECPKSELARVAPYVIHAMSVRHGEYDWGSYKRAYLYARDAGILDDYEYVYLLNDSVYGPVTSLADKFEKMESFGTDAFGMVRQTNSKLSYIQSWFIGLSRAVFCTKWFDEFMCGVTKLADKGAVTFLYEKGFTVALNKNGHTWAGLYTTRGRGVYNQIRTLYRRDMPFMKKLSFVRCRGALGRQFLYVFNHIDPALRDMLIESAYMEFGREYVDWFLTRNPLKIAWRHMKQLYFKVFIEGI